MYAQEGNDADAALVVLDWNLTSGARTEKLRVRLGSPMSLWDHAGDRAVLWHNRQLVLIDVARSTSLSMPMGVVRLLASGNVAVVAEGKLQIQPPDGTTVLSLPAGNGWGDGLAESGNGELLVGVFDLRGQLGERRTLVVDVASGRILREEPGIVPAPAGVARRSPARWERSSSWASDGSLVRLRPDRTREVLVAGQE